MTPLHLVRVGCLGAVGRFHSPEGARYSRGARVIVRTGRGLEIGDVLGATQAASSRSADGPLLRGMTVEDELLHARLLQNRELAYRACADRIAELGVSTVLMDVEHLFDGRTLYFYFLGDVSPELESATAELAELYDANVRFTQFADAVATGCGPDCGTDAAAGCGSCSTGCALAGACAPNADSA